MSRRAQALRGMKGFTIVAIFAFASVSGAIRVSLVNGDQTGVLKSLDTLLVAAATAEPLLDPLFVEPGTWVFLGTERCIASVHQLEERARRQNLSKKNLIELMHQRCLLEFDAAKESDKDSALPPYCDVVPIKYQPEGFGSLRIAHQLCSSVQQVLDHTAQLSPHSGDSEAEKFAESALDDQSLVAYTAPADGCCLQDKHVVEQLDLLEKFADSIKAELSKTHEMLHRSVSKWPEKALKNRVGLLTEQIKFCSEARDGYMHSLAVAHQYRETQKNLKQSPQNVTYAGDLAKLKGQLQVSQTDAALKYAIARHKSLLSQHPQNRTAVTAAEHRVEQIEVKLADVRRSAQSESMALVLKAEADAMSDQLHSLGDLDVPVKRMALKARAAQLLHMAARLRVDGTATAKVVGLWKEAQKDADRHPLDKVAQTRAERLHAGADARELQTIELLRTLGAVNADDCAECVVRVVGIMESALVEGVQGAILGTYMETFCEKALVMAHITDAPKTNDTCANFRDAIDRPKTEKQSTSAVITFCQVSGGCETSAEDDGSDKGDGDGSGDGSDGSDGSQGGESSESKVCRQCASEVIGGVGLLQQKKDMTRDDALSAFCLNRLRRQWLTHLSVVNATCQAAVRSLRQTSVGPVEELKQSFGLCQSMGECTSSDVADRLEEVQSTLGGPGAKSPAELAAAQKQALVEQAAKRVQDAQAMADALQTSADAVANATGLMKGKEKERMQAAKELNGLTKELGKAKDALRQAEAFLASEAAVAKGAQSAATAAESERIAAEMALQALEAKEVARGQDAQRATDATAERVQQQRRVSEANMGASVGRINRQLIGLRKRGMRTEEVAAAEQTLADDVEAAVAEDGVIQAGLDRQITRLRASNASAWAEAQAALEAARLRVSNSTAEAKRVMKDFGAASAAFQKSNLEVQSTKDAMKAKQDKAQAQLKALHATETNLAMERASVDAATHAQEIASRKLQRFGGAAGGSAAEVLAFAKQAKESAAQIKVTTGENAVASVDVGLVLMPVHDSDGTGAVLQTTPAMEKSLGQQLAAALGLEEEMVTIGPFTKVTEEDKLKNRTAFSPRGLFFQLHASPDANLTKQQLQDLLARSDLFVQSASGVSNPLPSFGGTPAELALADRPEAAVPSSRAGAAELSLDKCAKKIMRGILEGGRSGGTVAARLQLICTGELTARLSLIHKAKGTKANKLRSQIRIKCSDAAREAMADSSMAPLDRAEAFCRSMGAEVSEVQPPSKDHAHLGGKGQVYELPVVSMSNSFAWANGGTSFYTFNEAEATERRAAQTVNPPELIHAMEAQFSKRWHAKISTIRERVISRVETVSD